MAKSSKQLTSIPNGNVEVANPTYMRLLADYQKFGKMAAGAIVRLGQILCEADENLSRAEMKKFCAEVKLEYQGATYTKWMKIGEQANRFKPYMELLPNNWTTVYKLASLPDTPPKDKPNETPAFQKVVESPKFGPLMTADEINTILHPKVGSVDSAPLKRDVWIDMTALNDAAKVGVIQAMKELERQFNFQFKATQKIEKLVASKAGARFAA
jgi:hypothetical protein